MVLRQQIAEVPPQAPCLGESVEEHDRRSGPRAALFDMESHAW